MEKSLANDIESKENARLDIVSAGIDVCAQLDSGYSSPAAFLQTSILHKTRFSFENIPLATFSDPNRHEDDGTAINQDLAVAEARKKAILARKAKPRSISLTIPRSSSNLCSADDSIQPNRGLGFPRTHWYDTSFRRHSCGNLQPTLSEFRIIHERLMPGWRPFNENRGVIFTLAEVEGDDEESAVNSPFRPRSCSSPPILTVMKWGKALRDMGDDFINVANRRRNSYAQGQGDGVSLHQRTLGLARRAYSSLTSLPSALRRSSLPAVASESMTRRRRVVSEAGAQFLEINEDQVLSEIRAMASPSLPSASLPGASGIATHVQGQHTPQTVDVVSQ